MRLALIIYLLFAVSLYVFLSLANAFTHSCQFVRAFSQQPYKPTLKALTRTRYFALNSIIYSLLFGWELRIYTYTYFFLLCHSNEKKFLCPCHRCHCHCRCCVLLLPHTFLQVMISRASNINFLTCMPSKTFIYSEERCLMNDTHCEAGAYLLR